MFGSALGRDDKKRDEEARHDGDVPKHRTILGDAEGMGKHEWLVDSCYHGGGALEFDDFR